MQKQILNPQDLANAIVQTRKKQKITQEDLANMACVGRRFISDLENAKETIQIGKTLKVLKSLGIALNVSTHWS